MLVALWLVPCLAAGATGDLPLKVVGLDPEANYEPTMDAGDPAQLTDGRLNRYPYWTRRESVGWVNRTPVRITAAGDVQEGNTYSLTIRAAMETAATVYPPRRVDVYCQSGRGSSWRHAGGLTHTRNPAENGGVVDLTVRFAGCGNRRLQLVLNADGPFVLVDELTLRQATSAAEKLEADVTDPLTDSRRRLESSLLAAEQSQLQRSVRQRVTGPGRAWVTDAFGPLDVPTAGATPTSLRLPVAANNPASYLVAVANAAAESRRYTLKLTGGPNGTTVGRLMPVLAADGQLVFDAIDVQPATDYDVEGDGVLYLLVTEQGDGPAGNRRLDVSDDKGWTQSLSVDVQRLERLRPGPADQPRVLVWTYTNDRPLWRPETAAGIAASLDAAGVNVVDIHPAHIPAPLGGADWTARSTALKADLALFKGKPLALLFLGDTAWDRLVALPDDAASRRRLAAWVNVLKTAMRDADYGPDDWALYPVDEPHGEDLALLADVITRLRAIDKDLRFYANPSLGRGEQLTALPALWKLKSLVDYWQPRAGASFDTVASVLGRSAGSRLWVYDNPREPARSASPACYRALGVRAFDAGARGLGFWSFSSTNDSSAWSDFDGQQPDWAVAYESKSGFVASRRWEGFKQGVRDFALLSYCANAAPDDRELGAQCAAWRAAVVPPGGCGAW